MTKIAMNKTNCYIVRHYDMVKAVCGTFEDAVTYIITEAENYEYDTIDWMQIDETTVWARPDYDNSARYEIEAMDFWKKN